MPVQRSVQIVNEAGIHARPAAEIVKTAARFKSDVTIVKDGLDVNAKSIMGVMMLAAECGSTVVLSADGEDAQAAIDAIASVIAAGFGEALGEI
jgi:phosphocarrier protein HPr